jgi:hypothetical protein
MGMDVVGLKPTTQEGECFRNNVWWWRPLADYCMKVAPDIAVQCEHWQSNDGGGLDERNSVALAEVLQKEIDSGRCESYARIRESELELLQNEPCDWCGGTGIRKPPPEHGPGDLVTGIECNGCKGSGFRRPWACSYPFAVDNVQNFVIFLRGCGGFQIW